MPIPMSMPRFLNCRFPGFCQYRMEKKDFPEKMEALHDFPYFLISGLLTWFLVTAKQMLLKMLKSTTKTLEQDIKHVYSWNLKINIPEQHCQTVFCCFHCLLWMYFLPGPNFWLWTTEWQMGMLRVHFNNRYRNDHQ